MSLATQPTPCKTYSPMVSLLYNKAFLKPLFLRGSTLGRVGWSTESFSSPRSPRHSLFPNVPRAPNFARPWNRHDIRQGRMLPFFWKLKESRCVPVYAHGSLLQVCFGVGWSLNTEPHRVFGALGVVNSQVISAFQSWNILKYGVKCLHGIVDLWWFSHNYAHKSSLFIPLHSTNLIKSSQDVQTFPKTPLSSFFFGDEHRFR